MQTKILGKKGLSGALEWLVSLVMLLGVVCIVIIPWGLRWSLEGRMQAERLQRHHNFLVLLVEYTFIVCVGVLWQARKILININNRQPFILDNVRRIRKIALGAGLVALGCALGTIFTNSVFAALLAMVMVIVALMLVVCAELFHRAVQYKEENDQTI